MAKKAELTKLGKYLIQKSANRAEIFRKTSIKESRLSLLSNDPTTKLTAEELYLIALALDVEPGDFLKAICYDIVLNSPEQQQQLAAKSKKLKR
ncbi:MAG: XRE family transcriptional regulator [Pedobacter sp.]|nr:MAG: XRE family transcriptional regulator [Pedobacter sp.]